MTYSIRFVGACVTAAACFTALSGTASAQDTLRVKSGEVTVMCPLTVGGSFEAKTDAVDGEVAVGTQVREPLKGELTVDLQKLETGIGLRDRHMRNNYLEVERGQEFAEARLQDIRIERLDGKTTFRGTLSLHGSKKQVVGTADVKPLGTGYRVDANFKVRLSEFQIPDPTYLGVGVKDEVQIRVRLTAAPTLAAGRE